MPPPTAREGLVARRVDWRRATVSQRAVWSEAAVDDALARIRELGVTAGIRTAASAMGVTVNAVRKCLYDQHRERYNEAVAASSVSGLLAQRANVDSPIPEWLDRLRPVALPAPPKQTARLATASNATVVAGDFHFPKQDERTIAVLLKTITELRPKRLILNGDTVDLLAVSSYSKDQRHTWSLRDEAEAFHAFLHEAHRVGDGWGMEIVETEANHSGDGVASRWHRYLSDRVPHLYQHPRGRELLAYDTWWYPAWSTIRLIDDPVICDDLLITHGDIVRKNPAYSARAHAEKYHASVMHSHTHRMGMGIDRIPRVGTRSEATRRSYEIGCMCDTNPTYAKAPNWVNGFAIVIDNGEQYNVELVPVEHGVAIVNTLETTVRA